jgi:hypothetical protein
MEENFAVKAGIAGSSCAVIASMLNPVDVVKIRMQNSSIPMNQGEGMGRRIVHLMQTEGVAGLARGIYASVVIYFVPFSTNLS